MNDIRNTLIDALRGIAMIVMIVIHTTAFFPSDPIANPLWNWLHFAVPVFLFCSAYLFFSRYKEAPPHYWQFIKKRFTRLLIPYYIFLGIFLPAVFFISPETITPQYILGSVLLFGGVDINWLVILFLVMTMILPFIIYSWNHNRFLFWSFFVLSIASTIYFLFFKTPISYKAVMWLPWTTILYVTFFFTHKQKNTKTMISCTVISLLIFGVTYALQLFREQSLVFTHNKYPPNLFYLAYGTFILFSLSIIMKPIHAKSIFMRILHFFSRYSYQLYFIHYLVLTVLAAYLPSLHLSWISFTLIVLFLSVFIQRILLLVRK